MGEVRLDDEKHHAIKPSELLWSARKPIRPAIWPGHLVNKQPLGQISRHAAIHLGNV